LIRTLGGSRLAISPLGFGAWAMGGPGWSYDGSAEHDQTSVDALLGAIDGGVNWVDTAPTYGRGHCEELLGRAIRQARRRPMVFTKCGRHWDSPDATPYSDLRPAAIRSDCEASLRRLALDVIDLLQIHWPEADEKTPLEESWGEMLRLVDEGKVRAAGVCNFGVDLLERCEAVGHITSLQTPLSLIKRGATGGLLQWCAEHDVGVLAYSPMQVGLLTDSFTPQRVAEFAADDWRARDIEFLPPRLGRNLALRDALKPIAAAHDATVSAVAVAWVLSWSQVTGAIVGASSRVQVDGWIAASELRLSPTDLDQIASALSPDRRRRRGTGSHT
jgi:aryl-alcohol dehydrogenase-like predicted oxidoreductase